MLNHTTNNCIFDVSCCVFMRQLDLLTDTLYEIGYGISQSIFTHLKAALIRSRNPPISDCLFLLGKYMKRYECFVVNKLAIKKLAKEDGRYDLANDDDFLSNAANWSYTNFGPFIACYGSYLDFLENRTERMSEYAPQEWERLRRKIFKRDNYTCHYCGEEAELLELDHMVPISKGGTDCETNLTTSCRCCNRKKYNKSYEEFIYEQA